MEASEDIFVNDTSPAPVEEAMAPSNAPVDADGEGEASVEGLIPLCARHAAGPLLNLATFGYDIAQMERRPWREPGAKLSDYFNYGFNETSWRVYCAMQAEGEASLLARARETLQRLQLAAEGEGEGGNPPGGAGYDVQPYAEDNAAKGGGGGGYRAPFVGHHPMFNYKTKLCQRFAEGRCTKGGECTYAHGIGELRTAAAPPTGGGSAPMAKAPAYLTPPYQHGGGGYGGMPPPPPNTG